jgi:threonylcarbamoyladenosine tRNA methylthiotransferase MtaB
MELPYISTEIIVGFPGENKRHFENTLRLCDKAEFSRIHVFPFSLREGTPAAKMSDHCNPSEINARKKELEFMAMETSLRYKTSFIGRNINILIEGKRDKKTGKLCGYSDRYIKALFDGPNKLMNNIVNVHVKRAFPSFVLCKLLQPIENETY